MMVTLLCAIGDTKAPGVDPRYTSNTLSGPGKMSPGPRDT